MRYAVKRSILFMSSAEDWLALFPVLLLPQVARQMDGRFRFGYVTDEELIEKSKYKGSAVFIYKPVCNIYID